MKKPANEETLQEIKKAFEEFRKLENSPFKAAYLALQKCGFNSYDRSINGHIQIDNEESNEYVIFSEAKIPFDEKLFEKIEYCFHTNKNVFII